MWLGDVIMANKKPVVNALENAGVVVQIVEAPKAEFVLSLDQADRVEQIVDRVLSSEDHAFEADLGMEKASMMLAELLGTAPTYACWEATRSAWLRKYLNRKPNANEESADRAWSRLAKRMEKETGLTKPAKPSAEAQRKASKREEEKKALMSVVDSQLEQMLAAYKADDEFAKAAKVKAEMKRRSEEANKDQLEYAKELRADIAKRVKVVTDVALLEQIQAMLPELVDAVV
jgi:type II secretory ATPase GspE/PulE/Tfp pilus assembly ATPase PilB-like protein